MCVLFVYAYAFVHENMLRCVKGGLGTTLGTKLRSSDLATNTFTLWSILLTAILSGYKNLCFKWRVQVINVVFDHSFMHDSVICQTYYIPS